MAATKALTTAAADVLVRAADVRPVYGAWTEADASARQLVGQIPWGDHPVLLAKLEVPEQQKDKAAKLGAANAASLKGLRYGE